MTSFRLRNVPLLSRVGADRADTLRTDIDAAIAGWADAQLLRVDHVILCAGQEPKRDLADPLREAGKTVHLIGGCDVAMELDARRAIAQGTKLALAI
mgnify:CR=1 FL=1